MRVRIIILAALCGAMAWGGYQASMLRASTLPPGDRVLASAGRPGFAAGADGQSSDEQYKISALSVFSNVALHVKENYVDPERIDPKDMLSNALHEVERQIAEVLVEDLEGGRVRVSVPGHVKIVTIGDVESLWEINLKLRDVFRFFEKHLPPQKDMRSMEYAAINGALSTLDPHSILLKPEAFAEMKTSTKGEFGGLGIVISIRDAKLTIISPLKGTPASRAGLKAMDVISRIGDVSTVSMPIEEAVRMLRGVEGSKVTIWVARKGWPEPRKHTLTRQRIKIESVESQMLDDKIGYVQIKNFQQNTGHDLDQHIETLEKKAGGRGKLKGLVLDLRNNPGGLLEQAIKVSDKFLSSGDIVTTVGYGNRLREPKRASWSGSDLDKIPLIVLVNNGSASASEIVAGALKNLDRAVILGRRTFGKGSVQVLYDFADKSALKLTIAQYLTPGNISIQNVGVTPDIALKPARVEKDAVHLFYRPDGHREKNLNKHLDRAESTRTAPVDEPPEYEVTYLLEPQKKRGEDDPPPPPPKFEEDYPIKLAREILTAAGRSKRSQTLAQAKAFLTGRGGEESKRIQKAIEALEVPWQAGADASATAAVTASIALKGANKDGLISAGSEVSVIAEVTNQGTEPLRRMHGHLETENLAFKGREFLFGLIPPGATQRWEVKTKIPKDGASRSDILHLKLASGDTTLETEAKLAVRTRFVPHPQFAYSFSIDDQARGDGDGVLEKGEGVDFVVHVTNVGPGAADNVSLRLKSGAGENLFLERGRTRIGSIAPGETKAGLLRFKIREKQPTGNSLPLELTIYDPATGEWLEDELAVLAGAPIPAKLKKKSGGGVLTSDAHIFDSADSEAKVLATAKKGDRVRWTGYVDGWYRVELSKEAYGWVPTKSVKALKSRRNKDTLSTIAYHPARRPPRISLDGTLGGRVVTTDKVELSGTISGRKLRDMYVMLNDKKVFYQPGTPEKPRTTGDKWSPPDNQAVQLPFRHTLPLKEGLNRIVVVGRLDEKVITYRNLFVSRLTSKTTKVAEVDNGEPPAKRAN